MGKNGESCVCENKANLQARAVILSVSEGSGLSTINKRWLHSWPRCFTSFSMTSLACLATRRGRRPAVPTGDLGLT
jgi:hypothetical protein